MTEAGAKASFQAEDRINRGKAFWDVPIRLTAGLATMAAAMALTKYGGALEVGGHTLAQYADALVARIPGMAGGAEIMAAVDYLKTGVQATVAAVAAGYVGDRYKAGRKALDQQTANEKTADKTQELRDRGIDVDTNQYEQIHSLKAENQDLRGQIAEMRELQANVDRYLQSVHIRLAGTDQHLAATDQQLVGVENHLVGHDQAFQGAYASHVVTNERIDTANQRIDELASRPVAPPVVEPQPRHAAVPDPNLLLSHEDGQRGQTALDRAKQSRTHAIKTRPNPEPYEQPSGWDQGLPAAPPHRSNRPKQ
ncbi:hypothetical protein GCM10009765_01720 [Fodinicola feengrottensis]|uniref:Uncharacterized protein n=1 Tax=Fodinicola feengrottensis TaxID=435914 RepID=A0ABN2FR43_9ACTN